MLLLPLPYPTRYSGSGSRHLLQEPFPSPLPGSEAASVWPQLLCGLLPDGFLFPPCSGSPLPQYPEKSHNLTAGSNSRGHQWSEVAACLRARWPHCNNGKGPHEPTATGPRSLQQQGGRSSTVHGSLFPSTGALSAPCIRPGPQSVRVLLSQDRWPRQDPALPRTQQSQRQESPEPIPPQRADTEALLVRNLIIQIYLPSRIMQ